MISYQAYMREYMREYRKKNKERLDYQRRERQRNEALSKTIDNMLINGKDIKE